MGRGQVRANQGQVESEQTVSVAMVGDNSTLVFINSKVKMVDSDDKIFEPI